MKVFRATISIYFAFFFLYLESYIFLVLTSGIRILYFCVFYR